MAHSIRHLVKPVRRLRAARLPITDNPSTTMPMNRHAIERLRRCVLDDLDLQERLRVISGHDEFVKAVVELAGEQGLDLGAEEIEQEMNNARQSWLLRWL